VTGEAVIVVEVGLTDVTVGDEIDMLSWIVTTPMTVSSRIVDTSLRRAVLSVRILDASIKTR
jgi:hypothetical protein